jgi:hypothetical protein
MAKVGQLTIENGWLKKKSAQVFGPDYEKILISPNFDVSIKKQCELLEINRTISVTS